jgi:hypothetical protein
MHIGLATLERQVEPETVCQDPSWDDAPADFRERLAVPLNAKLTLGEAAQHVRVSVRSLYRLLLRHYLAGKASLRQVVGDQAPLRSPPETQSV